MHSHLMLRMAEVLDLSLCELSHANQTSSWRDLVPVGLADLGCCKGQFATIVVQQIPAGRHSSCCNADAGMHDLQASLR